MDKNNVYTVTYQPAKGSPSIQVPVTGPTADGAWRAFQAWREENGITDYHSATVTAPEAGGFPVGVVPNVIGGQPQIPSHHAMKFWRDMQADLIHYATCDEDPVTVPIPVETMSETIERGRK